MFALISEAVTIIKTGEIEQKKVQKGEKKGGPMDSSRDDGMDVNAQRRCLR